MSLASSHSSNLVRPLSVSPMRQAAPPPDPLLQYLFFDLLGISLVLVFHVADPGSIGVLQEEDTKLGVLGANLLGNIDPPLPPSKPHRLNHGWLLTYKPVVERCDVQ